MSAEYKLIGIYNKMDSVPDFVYPIFEKDGIYYMQDHEDHFSFKKLKDLKTGEIIFLNSIDSNELAKTEFFQKAPPMIGFQLSEDCVFIGTIQAVKVYLKSFHTKNMILRMEIEDFINNDILP